MGGDATGIRPKPEVRAAAVQMAVDWLDPKANLDRMARAFDEIASRGGADLVVFPELINQGYVKPSTDDDYKDFALAYRRCAELIPGPFTGAVGEMAKAHDCYVVAGMAEAHPAVTGSLYNSCVLIDPQGRVIDVHRKSHIPGHEKFYFYPGNTLSVTETDVGKIGMMICADYCYPELARALTLKGAEILCAPFANPTGAYPDPVIFNRMGASRAFENSNFMIACDRVGEEGEGSFMGRSCICDPFGRYLAISEGDDEEVLIATLRREEMELARASYNRFRDRRPDLYGEVAKPL